MAASSTEKGFAIFKEVIIREVSAENRLINEENDEMRSFRELLRNLVITNLFDKDIMLPITKGHLICDDEGFKNNIWKIPVERVPPVPLMSFLDINKTPLEIFRSGISCGCFPSITGNKIDIKTNKNGELRFYGFLSNSRNVISFEGKLDNFGPLDTAEGVEWLNRQIGAMILMSYNIGGNNTTSIRGSDFLKDSEHATFSLESVNLELCANLKDCLRLLKHCEQKVIENASLHQGDIMASDLLRHNIASACGGPIHRIMKKNRNLRLEKKALVEIHDYLQTVDVKHPNGCLSFKLNEGRIIESPNKTKGLYYFVEEAERGNSCIPMSDIAKVEILLSKRLISNAYGPGSISNNGRPPVFNLSESPIMELSYASYIAIQGTLDFGINYHEFPYEFDRRMNEALADFDDKFSQVLRFGWSANEKWSNIFPPWFSLRVRGVIIHEDFVKHLL